MTNVTTGGIENLFTPETQAQAARDHNELLSFLPGGDLLHVDVPAVEKTVAGAETLGEPQEREVTLEELQAFSAMTDEELTEKGFTREQITEALEAADAGGESEDDKPEGKTDEDTLSDFSKANVEKRIGKLTARAKTAEEALTSKETRIAELERQVQAGGQIKLAPTTQQPLLNVETYDQLQAAIADAQYWQTWAIENPDGGTYEPGNGKAPVEISEAQSKKLQSSAAAVLTVHAPQRSQWIAQAAQYAARVAAEYPDLLKPTSDMALEAQGVLKVLPELKRFPDWQLFIGHYLAAEKASTAKGAKDSQTTQKAALKKELPKVKLRLAPPVIASAGGKPTGIKGAKRDQAMEDATANFGSVESLMGVMAT